MSDFTLEELIPLIDDAAGDLDVADLDAGVADTAFVDLGLDSLAVMELTSIIKRTRGVVLPDGDIGESTTPSELVDAVNTIVSQAVRV